MIDPVGPTTAASGDHRKIPLRAIAVKVYLSLTDRAPAHRHLLADATRASQ